MKAVRTRRRATPWALLALVLAVAPAALLRGSSEAGPPIFAGATRAGAAGDTSHAVPVRVSGAVPVRVSGAAPLRASGTVPLPVSGADIRLQAGATAATQSDIAGHPDELEFPPLDFTPPTADRYRHILPNGTLAYVVEDHTLPLFSVSVVVRVGEWLEPPDKVGLANLVGSQMRAGGTERMSAAELDEEAAFLAAQIGTFVGSTQGGASVDCLSKDRDACLQLFFDVLRRPRFQEDRLELAKSQALQAMERRNDSTGSIEAREWQRLLYGPEHFSTRPTTLASIESITRDDLVEFHRRWFHPGSFIFAVAGDVDTDAILADLQSRMEGWQPGPDPVPEPPAPELTPEPGLYLVHKPDVNQGRVSIGHLGSDIWNPDRYALQIMNDILGGGGFTARLLTRIRSDEGLAYSAGSSFGLGTWYRGTFRALFQSRSETVARATAIVLEEVRRIRDEPVSEAELQSSKSSFIETFTRNFASAEAIAGLFADDEYIGRDSSYLIEYRDNIRSIGAGDVLRVAQEYLHPDRLVVLVVGNLDDILAGDPDHPEYSLADMAPNGNVVRIALPDPMTMEYPPVQR